MAAMSPAVVNDLVLSFTALLTLVLAVSLAAVIRLPSWPPLNPEAKQELDALNAEFEGDLRNGVGVRASARGRKEISKKDIRAEYRERRVRKAPRGLQGVTPYGGIIISGVGLVIVLLSLPHFAPLSHGVTKLLSGAGVIVAAMAMVYDGSDFLHGMVERRRMSKNRAQKDGQPRSIQEVPPAEHISEGVEKQLRRCRKRVAKDVEKEARRWAGENEITLDDIGEAWRKLVRPRVRTVPAMPAVRLRRASILLGVMTLVEVIAVAGILYLIFSLAKTKLPTDQYWPVAVVLAALFILYLVLVNGPRVIAAAWKRRRVLLTIIGTLASGLVGNLAWLARKGQALADKARTFPRSLFRARPNARKEGPAAAESRSDRDNRVGTAMASQVMLTAANDGGSSDSHAAAGPRKAAEEILESALRLRYTTQQITPEEFRWQESHYDHDSRCGRELLFLIANNEWIRATSEIIDVSRSDAVDTTIKVDIDLDRITHEAFRKRTGRFWLPVILLPPKRADEQEESEQRTLEPDPFATVTDAAGDLLPMLPTADIRHQVSAAMAEIIVNMAVARWSGGDNQRPTAARDLRLLLSAGIYRLLRRGVARGFYASPSSLKFGPAGSNMTRTVHIVNGGRASGKIFSVGLPSDPTFTLSGVFEGAVLFPGESMTATVTCAPVHSRNTSSAFTIGITTGANGSANHKIIVNLSATAEDRPVSRLDEAKEELEKLLSPYMGRSSEHSDSTNTTTVDGYTKEGGPSSSELREPNQEADRSALELTRRAVMVLRALAESVVVVVPVDRRSTPAVLTVRVPTREMVLQPSNRKLLGYLTRLLRPLGRLQIDVLLPSADADRHVQVNLPDGVRLEEPGAVSSSMDIQVEPAQPLYQLRTLISQLLDPEASRPEPVQKCLADLARAKAAATRETLRQHESYSGTGRAPNSHSTHATRDVAEAERTTADARAKLDELIVELNQLSVGQSTEAVRTKIREAWTAFDHLTNRLFRRTSSDKASPRMVVARADMIEDVSQRTSPTSAKIEPAVEVRDTEYLSIARFSGWMSLLLMTVVLIFFPVAHFMGYDTRHPAAEVLAIVLTLFSAHQATRIERPDRSTLRGLLSARGNWLIVASIMPTVILAVVLAFSPSWGWAVLWAGFCISLQLLLQCAMWRRVALVLGSRFAQPWEFQTKAPDYRHSDTLRSDWWRSTTADALMIGRQAHAYVVWQEGPSATLTELLTRAQRLTKLGSTANVLALLRSGTTNQTVTFVVFRGQPPDDWAAPAHQAELDLDPDRLAPLEHLASTVDVFLGIPRDCGLQKLTDHPLATILRAAKTHRLIVLEVQLPIPAPVAVSADCLWALVRVALRDTDTSRLAPFLDNIHADTARGKDGQNTQWVAARVVRSDGPRLIRGSAEPKWESRTVRAADIDVLPPAATAGESPSARTWRVLAICADARNGVEYDIVQKLGEERPQLQLAGLTYGLLHGTAVALLLGHEKQGNLVPNGDLGLEKDLTKDGSLAKLCVLVNVWRSRRELGHVEQHPLLQVHLRAQDRPGALLDVLGSLANALRAKLPDGKWRVWHAQIRVTGQAAFTSLTIRVYTAARTVERWQEQNTFDEIERTVRRLAVRDAAAARSGGNPPDDDLDSPEDPVISVDVIRAPAKLPEGASQTATRLR
jgi:hypothetical protein